MEAPTLSKGDRFGHFDIKLGDTARFPLSIQEFGRADGRVYPYTWEVVAFGGLRKRHCVLVRRRHDGLTRWLANHWFDAYANPFLRGGRQWPERKLVECARHQKSPQAIEVREEQG